MADDKDYSLGGKDRDEWDRLWGASTLRLVPGNVVLNRRTQDGLQVKALLISLDPLEFAARIWRESDVCPVCDQTTAGCLRLAAHLTIEYVRPAGWSFGFEPSEWVGVWAHAACIERCQETGRPAGIPW